ncbi:MAG: methylmalonyl-CoA epimerase [Gemmatimonadota bacterium]
MEYPVDHIAVAVASIEEALPAFEQISGARGSPPEEVPAQQVRVAFVGTGAGRLELLEPTAPDSPVARFLARRGPGLHHVAYRVPDVAAALAQLAAGGAELIDHEPRPGAHGRRMAFVHPRSAGGVLIELVEDS